MCKKISAQIDLLDDRDGRWTRLTAYWLKSGSSDVPCAAELTLAM